MIKFKYYSLSSPISYFPTPNPRRGFTIVELLVVIVVIGILASITIVSYAGISQKAKEASLQSDLNNASKLIKLYQVSEASGNFPTDNVCPSPGATEICLKPSGTNTYSNYIVSNATIPKTFTLYSTNGAISYRVTNDSTPELVTDPYATDPTWIAGVAGTAMEGKYVRSTNLGANYVYKTTITAVLSPQGVAGLDLSYPGSVSLVDPQIYTAVDFSEYPAQNACKAIGGRLPTMRELLAIYAGKVTAYGNNFTTIYYWSSTESGDAFARAVSFNNGSTYAGYKNGGTTIRCIAG